MHALLCYDNLIAFSCIHGLARDGALCTCTYMQGQRVRTVIYQVLARYAMTWSLSTLLLTAVATMASQASVPGGGPAQVLPVTLMRFVCAKCSETGQLYSWGLFLSREAVHRHIAVVIGCGLTPVKILFRLRLQKIYPLRNTTTTCKGTAHGLT
jgi:hypothetical protein